MSRWTISRVFSEGRRCLPLPWPWPPSPWRASRLRAVLPASFSFLSAPFRAGYLTIVIIGAVNTVISIFYYLNLVRMSYSREPESRPNIPLYFHEKVVCYSLIFLILYMGLVPFGLMDIFQSAF